MTPEKGMRVATAAAFLAGMLAGLDALRDAKVYWPPDAVWEALQNPKRFELGLGIALIVISLIVSVLRSRSN